MHIDYHDNTGGCKRQATCDIALVNNKVRGGILWEMDFLDT